MCYGISVCDHKPMILNVVLSTILRSNSYEHIFINDYWNAFLEDELIKTSPDINSHKFNNNK